ncbi:MAG TPA: hypothetical protein VHZ55_26460 [Bryobacteraceae bacterium]|jgi:hypothetical protein|nr:hypothetical protein [Bryobacteraceae bacterium]
MSAGNDLHADIISRALTSFPEQTSYVEYENLASLRRLRVYDRLEQRFAGKPLQEARIALGQLGIREDQVIEMVAASDPTGFYGIVTGTFSEQSLKRNGISQGSAMPALGSRLFCPGSGPCVLFLEDSVAAFGSLTQLAEIAQGHDGSTTRLSSNRTVVSLLNSTDSQAPVRGVLIGGQLEIAISDVLRNWTGWNSGWSQLCGNVRNAGYSVKFDYTAHVAATLECRSAMSATLLLQMFRLLGTVPSVSIPGGDAGAGIPFRNLHASSAGSTIVVKADTRY